MSIPDDPRDPSRRSFVQAAAGTVVTLAAAAGAGFELEQLAQAPGAEAHDQPRPASLGPVVLRVNGVAHHLTLPHQRTLLLALREDLGLTGTKKSCNLGQCGACTVLLDGLPVYSCFVLAQDASGREVTTIEGLEQGGKLHPVQQGFVSKMGSQCGHCTPGMILAGAALLASNPHPTEQDVKQALAGNLCRCGNYPHEIAGVLEGAALAGPRSPARAPAPGFNSSVPSLDAVAKATGRARYAGDVGFHADDPLTRPLVAKLIRSPFPHAEVGPIDDTAARRLPGYRGMITFRDVPGFGDPKANDRLFLNAKARHVGDPVAAIAADDQYTAQEALQLIRGDWRRLPSFPDAELNLTRRIQRIHPETLAGFAGPQPADKPTVEFIQGDLAAGFAQADLVVEGRYVTPLQCHLPIEMHCCVAAWEVDRLTVIDSQQSPHHAQEILANALRVPLEQVRVIAQYVGGGFGGKCTDTPGKTLYQCTAALLARKTARAVRLEYTLKESMYAEDTRNPFVFEIRTGVKRDGTLTALECRAIQRKGGYASAGPAVASVAGEGIIDTYRIPHYRYHAYCVYTNSPVGGEMRGFGHPQAVFAREAHMDKVAAALDMNPLELRRKNTLRTGEPITLGVAAGIPLANVGVDECLDRGAAAIGWHRWQPASQKTGRLRRGLGMRMSQEHTGRDASDGLLWMSRDGRIHVPLGAGNLGTEAHTAIALIVAEALGVPLARLEVTWGDSARTAWDYVTDASRGVHCHGKAMYNAALDLKNQLRGVTPRHTADSLEPRFDAQLDINPLLDEATGGITQHPTPQLHPVTLELARAALAEGATVGLGYYIYNPSVQGWGASFAEVEVDMETGQLKVLTLVGVHDCGKVIHRAGAEAQVHGGGVMGLGYAITEELLLDPASSLPLNQSLYEYRPLSILDIPALLPVLVEAPVAAGPYGAKGLGENPMFDGGGAVANAVFNATGVHITELPITWSRLYRQLQAARGSSA
ncbi:MAG TPA: molybdopterin cofactor-binding domain-containing protein [Gemmatimonadales bacterium]